MREKTFFCEGGREGLDGERGGEISGGEKKTVCREKLSKEQCICGGICKLEVVFYCCAEFSKPDWKFKSNIRPHLPQCLSFGSPVKIHA